MKNDDEILKLREFYKQSKDNRVLLSSGNEDFGDLYDFYRVVDFFASRYGLGGCKSISEFSDMIDNCDPVEMNVLRDVAIEAERLKWGTGGERDNTSGEADSTDMGVDDYALAQPVPKQFREGFENKKTTGAPVNGQVGMRRFLKSWGVASKDLDIASEKLAKRKIKLKDFSYLANERGRELINMSPAEFKKVKKEIIEQGKKSENFVVSLKTLIKGQKNG